MLFGIPMLVIITVRIVTEPIYCLQLPTIVDRNQWLSWLMANNNDFNSGSEIPTETKQKDERGHLLGHLDKKCQPPLVPGLTVPCLNTFRFILLLL